MSESETLILPTLREDLQFEPGPVAADGSPTWTLYDPARGRYYRISWKTFQMLSHWSSVAPTVLIEKIDRQTTCRLSVDEVTNLIKFLFINNLTSRSIDNNFYSYYQQFQSKVMPWYIQLFHSYLFFRIPLLRPDRFLRASLPYVQWCFNWHIVYLLAGLGLLGLYLVSRQWDVFLASFLHFFNWQGVLCYVLAISLAKTLHELGHAYTAIHYGCKVPSMGVAFMALLPMPYTDVTDVWRLRSRSQRVAVGGAGILVELALAILATLFWNFIPDGSLRSAAFVLATTTWVMTFTINISPFMRFDGYYMLADAWGIDNLQIRAFALARWRLRNWLFISSVSKPEILPAGIENKMLIYAYSTWLYRLVLFFGLALMVYHFFFKALGILLFLLEIGFFIVKPVFQEMREWRNMRSQTPLSIRKNAVGVGLLLMLLFSFFPWSDHVRVAALLESEQHQTLYVAEAAQLKEIWVKPGLAVTAGQLLFKLQSPKLEDEITLSEKRRDLFQLRMERAATSQDASADIQVFIEQFTTESARLAGLKHQRDRLLIRAPFSGMVVDMYPDLQLNNWIDTNLPLATIIAPDQALVRGIVAENMAAVLTPGQTGRFIPEDAFADGLEVQVAEISKINLRELDQPYLASIFGGDIAVKREASGKLLPTSSFFAVRFLPQQQLEVSRKIRGTVVVNAKPRSFFSRLLDSSLALLIRESGF